MESILKIGDLQLENNIIVGPMAGISNLGFRTMIKSFGPGLIYSEMISDKAITYKNKKTLLMTEVSKEESPLALQLFGHDVDSMVEAAKYLDEKTNCDIIDINMGCPVPKVVNNHSGNALMKEPEYASEMVGEIVKNVKKPVTVKMRSGWDQNSINCVELAQLLEKVNVAAVCIHPRTKTEFYSGHSNWDLIRQVKQAVDIPVIGNGDIKSIEDLIAMKQQTNCDGFMIARGCLGNPWLIQQLVHYQKTGERLSNPSVEERLNQCLSHGEKLIQLKGERIAMKEMRGHACWYINGLPSNNKVKAKLNDMTTYAQLEEIFENYKIAIQSEDYSYFL